MCFTVGITVMSFHSTHIKVSFTLLKFMIDAISICWLPLVVFTANYSKPKRTVQVDFREYFCSKYRTTGV